jgi:hypothetical protein
MNDDAASREAWRRWRLVLGGEDSEGLSDRDGRLDAALRALDGPGQAGGGRRGSLGGSMPKVARWLGDIREFFPAPVVQLVQRDAFDRLGLKQMLLEPEFLAAVEADVHLVADLITLRSVMPDKAKDTARMVVRKVVAEVMQRLEATTTQAVRGALNRAQRTNRPRANDIDWPRTNRANLQHWHVWSATAGRARGGGSIRWCCWSINPARWPHPSSTPRSSRRCWP